MCNIHCVPITCFPPEKLCNVDQHQGSIHDQWIGHCSCCLILQSKPVDLNVFVWLGYCKIIIGFSHLCNRNLEKTNLLDFNGITWVSDTQMIKLNKARSLTSHLVSYDCILTSEAWFYLLVINKKQQYTWVKICDWSTREAPDRAYNFHHTVHTPHPPFLITFYTGSNKNKFQYKTLTVWHCPSQTG